MKSRTGLESAHEYGHDYGKRFLNNLLGGPTSASAIATAKRGHPNSTQHQKLKINTQQTLNLARFCSGIGLTQRRNDATFWIA